MAIGIGKLTTNWGTTVIPETRLKTHSKQKKLASQLGMKQEIFRWLI